MIGENDFVSQTERKINNWKEEILRFRVITEVADPDDQNANYHVIEELVAKGNVVLAKLTEFKASNAVDRPARIDPVNLPRSLNGIS